MPERVGFLGLGIMGSRMAANVARAGFPLTVWTHTPGKAARWASEHDAVAVATPAEVARASDIVVSMVVDGEQVASVLLGEGGVIEAGRARPAVRRHVHDRAARHPADRRGAARARGGMLDAPVTGSSPRAEDGSLTIMAGGEPADFERARPAARDDGQADQARGRAGPGRDAQADQQRRSAPPTRRRSPRRCCSREPPGSTSMRSSRSSAPAQALRPSWS